MTVSAQAAISVSGLVKRYGGLAAVDGIDLEIGRGECFGLLGPNGAGKTTTVEILEGLLPPTAGRVGLLGRQWGRDDRELRCRIGIALQQTQLAERLNVAETIGLFRSFYPSGRTVAETIGLVGLADKASAWVMKLSGGQRQRLALACALVGQPELLFLDEPTTGLDPASRRAIWGLVAAFRTAGGTVLLTTHYMEEAERLCNRVAVIDRGRILACGAPQDLVERLQLEQVVELSTEPELDPGCLLGLPGVVTAVRSVGRLRVGATSLHLAVPAILGQAGRRGVVVTALATRPASLEDVFLELTGRSLRGEA